MYLIVLFQIGKVDEIFGTPTEIMVSVKLREGFKASSFEKSQPVSIICTKGENCSRFEIE